MKKSLTDIILPQIDNLLKEFENLKREYEDEYYDIPHEEISKFVLAGAALITRATGTQSSYYIQIIPKLEMTGRFMGDGIPLVAGALKALQYEIINGYLVTVETLINANLFNDFLEMAEHLLGEQYKDPAAVLIGGVLEEHLRKLCDKNGIEIEFTDFKGNIKPKKSEMMNADLYKSGVYNGLVQKQVTTWLDLRNKAAHGKYSEYDQAQVNLMVQGVRDFLVQNAA